LSLPGFFQLTALAWTMYASLVSSWPSTHIKRRVPLTAPWSIWVKSGKERSMGVM
jgi:hypothetical protein